MVAGGLQGIRHPSTAVSEGMKALPWLRGAREYAQGPRTSSPVTTVSSEMVRVTRNLRTPLLFTCKA